MSEHDEQHAPYASAESVAGLAREVDELRRGLFALDGLPERVDDLATAVAELADTVTHLATHPAPSRPAPTPAPSWLVAPTDPEPLARVLDALCTWLRTVYLRYGDAAHLPECWLWHPEVIEELLWLQHAWLAAYQGPAASVALAGDWHDRQRPGVVRRIKVYAGSCSRENHQTRPGWTGARRGPVVVPGVDTHASTGGGLIVPMIVAWWATAREADAPEPPHDPTRDPSRDPGRDPSRDHRPYPPPYPPPGPRGTGGPEWGPWR